MACCQGAGRRSEMHSPGALRDVCRRGFKRVYFKSADERRLTAEAACVKVNPEGGFTMKKDIKSYLAKIGAKGGKAGIGKSKRRGDSEYYRQLRKKSAGRRGD